MSVRQTPPTLRCLSLPSFDRTDLTQVRNAFRDSRAIPLGQAWNRIPDPGFAPAEVRVGQDRSNVVVLAQLTDADIFTTAEGLNERLWERGDAFEMFLGPEEKPAYIELQVAPNNQRLQLRYPNRAALDQARETGNLTEAWIPGAAFQSATWIEKSPSRWSVLAEIPIDLVDDAPGNPHKMAWRFSFSRYDHTRGATRPVLSSSSPHLELDFHRQEDWGRLVFGEKP
jgi:hypothetical protein